MGRQVAEELALAGANVLAVGRDKTRLLELQSLEPERISCVQLDVISAGKSEWIEVLDAFVAANGKLNGGVYAAGITALTPLRLFDDELAQRILSTSLWGWIHFLQYVSKKRFSMPGASYVVFSSAGADSAESGMTAYDAAKAGVRAAMKVAALELSKKSHRVNSISPGWVGTRMTQQYDNEAGASKRVFDRHLLGLGKPEDVSGMVLFLLSDRARWITGADILVDGGYLRGAYR